MRYDDRRTVINNTPIYRNYLKKRNLKQILHYSSPFLLYPTDKELESLTTINHVWKYGDRYYKLSHKYYGDTQFWWVIAGFNQKPTENHVELGEMIYIPQPLEDILFYMGI